MKTRRLKTVHQLQPSSYAESKTLKEKSTSFSERRREGLLPDPETKEKSGCTTRGGGGGERLDATGSHMAEAEFVENKRETEYESKLAVRNRESMRFQVSIENRESKE